MKKMYLGLVILALLALGSGNSQNVGGDEIIVHSKSLHGKIIVQAYNGVMVNAYETEENGVPVTYLSIDLDQGRVERIVHDIMVKEEKDRLEQLGGKPVIFGEPIVKE